MRNSNRQLAHQKTRSCETQSVFFWKSRISHTMVLIEMHSTSQSSTPTFWESSPWMKMTFKTRKTWKTAQFTRFSKELCGSPYHWYWFIARAGCGVCGLSAFGAIKGHFAPPKLLWLPWVFVLFLRREKDPKWHLVREHRRCFLACE